MWLHDLIALELVTLILIFLMTQTGAGSKIIWQQIRPVLLLLLVLAAYTSWIQSPVQALEMTLRLLCLMMSGLLVTLTTSLTQMMGVLEVVLTPLEKIGLLRAERVALTFGLTLRLIPELSVQWHEIREAQAARGLKANMLTLGVPMLLRTLKRADAIAEAIDARSAEK